MKTALRFIFPIIFALFAFSFNSYSQQIKVVEINASALVEDKNTDNYSILIYNDGQLKDSIFCKKSKAVTLSLESNKLYSIVYKKANYSNKLVIVDTKIPSGLREMIEDPFELQVELAKTSTSKPDLTDYPIAILSVSRKEKSLMASENYYKLTHE